MILEGVVTTLDSSGRVHIAPMGPRVSPDMRRLILRPFKSSNTYQNLKRHAEGVFHVTDDAELIARAAVGQVEAPLRPALEVRGFVLEGACRAYEFRVVNIDDGEERTTIEAEVVRVVQQRDFFGFNRAKHAILEAAILATRVHLLPADEILARFAGLAVLVEKTGGEAERRSFEFLRRKIEEARGGAPGRAAPLPQAVRVSAGSRLHFGLLAPGAGAARRFGGAGVMVAHPPLTLRIERGARPPAAGVLAERALELARSFTAELAPPYTIQVEEAPPAHVGLGTGTQLALAVARGISALAGEDLSAVEIAHRLERGRRSAVGIHGFELGGFLVDGGKRQASGVAPLVARHAVPEAWRIVLAIPRAETGLSGSGEEEAFNRIAETSPQAIDALCRTLLLGILPALAAKDFAAFGEALYEYGFRAGECFAAVQGGAFMSACVAERVRFIRSQGVAGAGQSSWGPTVYAFLEDEERAQDIGERMRSNPAFASTEIVVTPPLNHAARVDVPGKPSTSTLA